MTWLETAVAAVALLGGLGGIATGVGAFIVRGVRKVAQSTTNDLVGAVDALKTEVSNLAKSIDRLWEKSDEGERLHREHASQLGELRARVDGLRPKPKRRKRRGH